MNAVGNVLGKREIATQFQVCVEYEHFRYEHELGTGYCRYGPNACPCAEFESLTTMAPARDGHSEGDLDMREA